MTAEVVKTLTEGVAEVKCFALIEDTVWCGLRSGSILVYSKDELKPLRLIRGDSRSTGITCITAATAQHAWVGESDGSIIIREVELKSGHAVRKVKAHQGTITCLLRHKGVVWSGSNDFNIKAWEAKTLRTINILKGHRNQVRCLLVVDECLWSGADDRNIIVWDLKTGEQHKLAGHKGGVTCMCLVHHGGGASHVWSGSADFAIRMWNPKTLQCLKELKGGHTNWVNFIAPFGAGEVWSGSLDKSICCWDATTGKLTRRLPQPGALTSAIKTSTNTLWTFSGKQIKVWQSAATEIEDTVKEGPQESISEPQSASEPDVSDGAVLHINGPAEQPRADTQEETPKDLPPPALPTAEQPPSLTKPPAHDADRSTVNTAEPHSLLRKGDSATLQETTQTAVPTLPATSPKISRRLTRSSSLTMKSGLLPNAPLSASLSVDALPTSPLSAPLSSPSFGVMIDPIHVEQLRARLEEEQRRTAALNKENRLLEEELLRAQRKLEKQQRDMMKEISLLTRDKHMLEELKQRLEKEINTALRDQRDESRENLDLSQAKIRLEKELEATTKKYERDIALLNKRLEAEQTTLANERKAWEAKFDSVKRKLESEQQARVEAELQLQRLLDDRRSGSDSPPPPATRLAQLSPLSTKPGSPSPGRRKSSSALSGKLSSDSPNGRRASLATVVPTTTNPASPLSADDTAAVRALEARFGKLQTDMTALDAALSEAETRRRQLGEAFVALRSKQTQGIEKLLADLKQMKKAVIMNPKIAAEERNRLSTVATQLAAFVKSEIELAADFERIESALNHTSPADMQRANSEKELSEIEGMRQKYERLEQLRKSLEEQTKQLASRGLVGTADAATKPASDRLRELEIELTNYKHRADREQSRANALQKENETLRRSVDELEVALGRQRREVELSHVEARARVRQEEKRIEELQIEIDQLRLDRDLAVKDKERLALQLQTERTAAESTMRQEITGLRSLVDEKDRELRHKDQQLRRISDDVARLRSEFEQSLSEVSTQHREEKALLQGRIESLETRITTLSSERDRLLVDRQELIDRIRSQAQPEELEQLREQLEQSERDRVSKAEQLRQLGEQVAELRGEFERSLREVNERYAFQLRQKETELESLEQQLIDAEAERERMAVQHGEQVRQNALELERRESEAISLRRELEGIKRAAAESDTSTGRLIAELERVRSEFEHEHQRLLNDKRELEACLHDKESELSRLEVRVAELEEERESVLSQSSERYEHELNQLRGLVDGLQRKVVEREDQLQAELSKMTRNYEGEIARLRAVLDEREAQLQRAAAEHQAVVSARDEQIRQLDTAVKELSSSHELQLAEERARLQALFASQESSDAEKHKAIMVELHNEQTQREKALSELSTVQNTMKELRDELANKTARIAELERQREQLGKELESIVKKAQNDLAQTYNDYRSEIGAVRAQSAQLQTLLQDAVTTYDRVLAERDGRIRALEAECDTLRHVEAELQLRDKEIQEKSEQLSELGHQVASLREQFEKQLSEIIIRHQSEKDQQLQLLRQEAADLRRQVEEQFLAEIGEKDEKIRIMQEEVECLSANLERNIAEMASQHQAEVAALSAQLTRREEQLAVLAREVHSLKLEIEQKERDISLELANRDDALQRAHAETLGIADELAIQRVANEQLNERFVEADAHRHQRDRQLEEANAEIARLHNRLSERQNLLGDKEDAVRKLADRLAEKDAELDALTRQLRRKDEAIAEQERAMTKLTEENALFAHQLAALQSEREKAFGDRAISEAEHQEQLALCTKEIAALKEELDRVIQDTNAQHMREIRALEEAREKETVRASSAIEAVAERDRQLKLLASEIHQLQRKMEDKEQMLAADLAAKDTKIRELNEVIAARERAMEELRSAYNNQLELARTKEAQMECLTEEHNVLRSQYDALLIDKEGTERKLFETVCELEKAQHALRDLATRHEDEKRLLEANLQEKVSQLAVLGNEVSTLQQFAESCRDMADRHRSDHERRLAEWKLLIDSKTTELEGLQVALEKAQKKMDELQNAHRAQIEQLEHAHRSEIQNLLQKGWKREDALKEAMANQMAALEEHHRRELAERETQLQVLERVTDEVKSTMATTLAENAKLLEQWKEAVERVSGENTSLKADLQAAQSAHEEAINEMRSKLHTQNEQLGVKDETIDELRKQLAQLSDRNTAAARELNELRTALAQLRDQQLTANKEATSKDAQMAQLRQYVADLEANALKSQQRCSALEAEVASLTEQVERWKGEAEQNVAKSNATSTQCLQLEKELRKCRQQLAAFQQDFERLEGEAAQLRSRLEVADDRVVSLQKELAEANSELRATERSLVDAEDKLKAALEEKRHLIAQLATLQEDYLPRLRQSEAARAEVARELEGMQRDYQRLYSDYQAASEELATLRVLASAKESEKDLLIRKLEEVHNADAARLEEVKREASNFRELSEKAEQQLQLVTAQNQALTESNESLKQALAEANQRCEQFSDDLARITNELTDIRSRLAAETAARERLEHTSCSQNEEIRVLQASLSAVKHERETKIAELSGALSKATTDLSTERNRADREAAQRTRLAADLEALQQNIAALRASSTSQVESLKHQVATLEAELQSKERVLQEQASELSHSKEKVRELSSTLTAVQAQHEATRAEISRLTTELEQRQSAHLAKYQELLELERQSHAASARHIDELERQLAEHKAAADVALAEKDEALQQARHQADAAQLRLKALEDVERERDGLQQKVIRLQADLKELQMQLLAKPEQEDPAEAESSAEVSAGQTIAIPRSKSIPIGSVTHEHRTEHYSADSLSSTSPTSGSPSPPTESRSRGLQRSMSSVGTSSSSPFSLLSKLGKKRFLSANSEDEGSSDSFSLPTTNRTSVEAPAVLSTSAPASPSPLKKDWQERLRGGRKRSHSTNAAALPTAQMRVIAKEKEEQLTAAELAKQVGDLKLKLEEESTLRVQLETTNRSLQKQLKAALKDKDEIEREHRRKLREYERALQQSRLGMKLLEEVQARNNEVAAQKKFQNELAQLMVMRMLGHGADAAAEAEANPNASTSAAAGTAAPRRFSLKESVNAAVKIQAVFKGYLARKAFSNVKRRTAIAREILSTEKTYVQCLEIIVRVFLQPLRTMAASTNEAERILTEGEIRSIFSSVEEILHHHQMLLESLSKRMQKWNPFQKIGDIFLNMIRINDHLQAYVTYVNNYNQAIETWKAATKNPKLQDFLRICRIAQKHELKGKELPDFLIMPIQRIPRYLLLLQDLFKHTSPSHQDYENLKLAAIKIRELTEFINEQKREYDTAAEVSAIQSKISECPDLLADNPRRTFSSEGPLIDKRGKALQVFLFSDIIVIARPAKKKAFVSKVAAPTKPYVFKALIDLRNPALAIVHEGETGLNLKTESESTVLYAKTPTEKQAWIIKIRTEIGKLK